ncbi:hypothetical protein JCM11491_000035 [Sporobolomyces phaffii]
MPSRRSSRARLCATRATLVASVSTLVALSLSDLVPRVAAQSITHQGSGEGAGLTGPTSSTAAAGYSCDPNTCKLPSCQCASTSPPGGLSPQDVPQFVTFTADDAIQSYTLEVLDYFLARRKNPNGCSPKMTYFNSLTYSNYSMVTDWYVAGNEIADHTMTHVGSPNASEIYGNLRALNAFAGIPMKDITGFRAPMLNWTTETLKLLHDANFVYDSSATSSIPANASGTDAYWPYTLDNGLANDCLVVEGACKGQLKLPGLWEIPMYAIFEKNDPAKIHLMDPWLEGSESAVLEWMKDSFLSHYNGNRAPFGLYSHPIHLAVGYPGVKDPVSTRAMIQNFLDWVQAFPNVWIVSNQQMMAWLQNPVKNSDIGSVDALGCKTPDVPSDAKLCNGIPQNEIGLLNRCPFEDFPWQTCYYCPATEPTPENPVPPPRSGDTRHTLPANCSTAFFNPQTNECLCSSSACAFTDSTKPIGNYSTNLGGDGTGGVDANGNPTATRATAAERTAPVKQNGGASKFSASSSSVAALAFVGLGSAILMVAA